MKYGYVWFFSLWIALWFTLPVFASTDSVPVSGKNWNAQQTFILKVQQREEQGGKGIYSYDSELYRTPELFREHQDKTDNSTNKDTRSYSDFLGPSFDNPGTKDDSSKYDSWWDNQSSADPMVKDLSRKDAGGSSSEGSSAGSVPGSHGN